MVDSISKPLAQEDEALIQELLEKQAAEYIVEIVNVAAPAFHKNAVVGMSQKDFARSLAAIMHAAVFPLMKEKQDGALKLADCYAMFNELAVLTGVVPPGTPATANHRRAIGAFTAAVEAIKQKDAS